MAGSKRSLRIEHGFEKYLKRTYSNDLEGISSIELVECLTDEVISVFLEEAIDVDLMTGAIEQAGYGRREFGDTAVQALVEEESSEEGYSVYGGVFDERLRANFEIEKNERDSEEEYVPVGDYSESMDILVTYLDHKRVTESTS